MSNLTITLIISGLVITSLLFLVKTWRSLNNKVDFKELNRRQILLEKEFYEVIYKNKKDIEYLKENNLNKKSLNKNKVS
jgi:hypothetical protein